MRQPVPFGKYLLLDRISVGGMAEVFKAKSYGVEGFEKIIAIKRILPTMGEDRDFIKMFIDEAKIAGQLAHANICQIFELGRIDGSHFIAMEYIWGKDLLQIQNRIRKNKQQLPIPMACFCIAKVLEGLDYAHRKRDPLGRPLEIVHRDCSPQNVLVSYEGEVKVIDFGIAKATSRNSRTMAGVLKGKFGYMSPEQVRGLPLDRRSDIFAIGTMLYECLTGERLFQGETDFSTLEKVRNVDIQAPRTVNPSIPESVERVILKALARDVEDRYQWCSEMLADLQQYLMAQDMVFTAKSLSSWLKETFQQEIERERQQLEQYKRVGRDGLIAGVPAAQAKLDVNEHLGEAGAPEGDATVLGGPNFDDIERDAGASPAVPAARQSSPPKQAAGEDDDDGDPGDFGEEQPTEIFGELGGDPQAPAPAPAAMPAAGRTPTGNPLSRPPRPPPSRPPTQRPPDAPGYSQPMAAQGAPGMPMAGQSGPQPAMLGQQPPPGPQGYAPPGQSGPYMGPPGYGPPQGSVPPHMAGGTPGLMASEPANGGAQNTANKTVLGVSAPAGLGNYGGYRPSQQHPQQGYPQQGYSQQGYPQQGYPQQGYPQQQGYAPPGYSPGYPSYPGMPSMQGPPGMQGPGMPAVEPGGEGRKSTLVRDIGIGVAIAALVLIGFLVIKLFVLDSGDSKNASTTPTSTIATIRLSLPPGVTVQMFVDGKVAGSALRDKDEVPVSAGLRTVKLVGPKDQTCDEPIKLEAGQTTTVKCDMLSTPAAATGSGSGSASAGSGSAGSGSAGSGSAGSGSAGAPAIKPAESKPADAKATDSGKIDLKGSAATTTAKVDTKPADPSGTMKTVKPADTKTPTTTTTTIAKAPDPKTTPDTSKPVDKGDGTQGFLQVSSKPVAKILVDGSDSGHSTPSGGHTVTLTLAPGKHKITFVIGDDRFTYPVTIKTGQTETMTKDLQ